jgi:tRNA modification GTPase
MPQVYLPDEDTIAALATPPGEGGIAVIRISGKRSTEITEKVFKRAGEGAVSNMKSHRLYRGHIVDPESGEIVDSVLCVLMKSPHSYTGEDVVEIHSHGGYLVPKRILDAIFRNEVRPAGPGEFTFRAFLNGKMDLAQAEAVADIVNAQTEEGLKQAELQLEGVLSGRANEFKEILLDALAEIEAQVDFPEEGIDPIVKKEMIRRLTELIEEMDKLLATFEEGRIIKNGVHTAIIGKPNVGKSSLLNQLLMKERAIVSPYPGTTRDFIEETINIKGIPLRLVDTAGLRVTVDEVEKLGVEFAKKKAEEAELIIAVVDGSRVLGEDDFEVLKIAQGSPATSGVEGVFNSDLLREINDNKNAGTGLKPASTLNQNTKKGILIINKADLPQQVSEERLTDFLPEEKIVQTSAKLGLGIEKLKDKIYEVLLGRKSRAEGNEVIITELRHKIAIQKSKESILAFLEAMEMGKSSEFLAVDLRGAMDCLSEVTGDVTTEDILGRIFSKFCIGK